MSKSKRKFDKNQPSLFDMLKQIKSAQDAATAPALGSLNIQHSLRAELVHAAKPFSRHQIAAKMSELLGLDVSKAMLDAYLAESKEYHRFPAEYLPAFCEAVGSISPLEVLGRAAGVFVVPGEEALRAHIQRLEEEKRRITAEQKKYQLYLKDAEQC